MAVKHPIEVDIVVADAAARHARSVREFHARRTRRGSDQRESDIAEARERIRAAMAPLRSHLGKAASATQTAYNVDLNARVSEASLALQAERRKLWKMTQRPIAPKDDTE